VEHQISDELPASAQEEFVRALAVAPPALPPKRAKLLNGVICAARQGRSSSAQSPRRPRMLQHQDPLMMTARMTKQGMNPAIIPNKNHWYASISYQAGSETAHALAARILSTGLVTTRLRSDLATMRQ